MKRLTAAVMFFVLFIAAGMAENELPTAQELYARYPVPEAELTMDPFIDPLLRLVNKQNGLKWDYVPEYVEPQILNKKGVTTKTTKETALALESMFAAAAQEGVELVAVSGYRSYSAQKLIYERKVKERGKASASLSSAPPGRSEHQLGMAMDISSEEIDNRLNPKFADTQAGKWLAAHCAEYGFIIRYKTEWTKITGYKGEPWHVRYIGPEHAAFLTKLNVPFEIYHQYLKLCYDGMAMTLPR